MKPFLQSIVLGATSALSEMRTQPLRSGLSIIGVALAVGALAALLSIIGGLQSMVRESIADMGGAGRIMVNPTGAVDGTEQMRFSRSPGLRVEDGEDLRTSMPGKIEALKTVSLWSQATYLGQTGRVNLMGVDRNYLVKDVSAIITQGAFPDSATFARGASVALIGWTLADEWQTRARSRGRELIGSQVVVGGVPYTIAGAFRFKRNNWGRNGITVAIPWNAFQKRHVAPLAQIGALQLRVEVPESTHAWQPDLEAALLSQHRGARDFSLQMFDFVGEITRMIGNISLLFGVVALLSLLVGALGIFNTMLAGLYDRVREIGVRKALGARRAQIMIQFLSESVVLSAMGGLVGLGIGCLPAVFGDLLYKAVGIRPVFDFLGMAQAFAISVAIGIGAGLWPAWKASRLDPVDALRYE